MTTAVFKTVCGAVILSWVGSTPMSLRHLLPGASTASTLQRSIAEAYSGGRSSEGSQVEPGVLRQTMSPLLAFSVQLEPARLLRARQRVADYLLRFGVPQRTVDEVVLAVHEAVANAVRHSGAEESEIRLDLNGADLRVTVVDRGCGFDVATVGPDRPPDPESPGGRGLYLMAQLMDGLELESAAGVTVRMVKRDVLAGAERPPDEVSVVEEVPEGFAALDWEYTVRYANRIGLELAGLSREEALGRDIHEVFPALSGSDFGRRLEDAMELGIPFMLEVESSLIGRFVEVRLQPTGSGVSISICDVEERKRREQGHERGRSRAELLARTTARLLSAEEPQRVVDDLCADVMEHLGCHVFFNYLADPRLGCLVLNAYAGIGPEDAHRIELLDFGVAVCGCAAAQAERIVAEDIQHSDDARADLVRSFGVQAYCAHPLLARGEVLGTLSFGTRDRPAFTPDELALMKTVADHVAIAIDRDRAERELRRRGAEVAARDERSRLARDLHDSVTQSLFAASLKAEALTLDDGPVSAQTAETVEQVRRLTRGALAQMRTMLLELRTDPLEAVPIQQLLRNLVDATESRARVEVTLRVTGDSLVAPALHVAIYRITQEALNNIVRHAAATHARVVLELGDAEGRLMVDDDGCGFAPEQAGPDHLGLRSMRERAAEAGAELQLSSAPGEGTTVTLVWPAGRGAG